MAPDRAAVPAVAQALRVIEHLAAARAPIGVSELARALGLPKSTCHAILRTLAQDGYATQLDDLRWVIGLRVWLLMAGERPLDALRHAARPALEAIVARTGWPAHLGVREGGEVLYVDKVEPQRFIRFATYPGLRARLHLTALGKALIADLPAAELRSIVDAQPLDGGTAHAIRTRARLDSELRQTRERGYAVEWEEGEAGVCCVAVPVAVGPGAVVGALGITALVAEMGGSAVETTGRLLQEQARRLARSLGTQG